MTRTYAGIPVTVIEDALLLAALEDLGQHQIEGSCPDCTPGSSCEVLRAAELTVDALAPGPGAVR